MPTAEQQRLVANLHRLLEAEPRVEAAWLAGSLGRGAGDAFSDVDILALTTDGAAAALSAELQARFAEVTRPVLVNRLFGGRILSVVTEDWARFDITLAETGDLSRYNATELTVLFNRGERAPLSRTDPAYHTTPEQLLPIVQEFLRVLGLAVVGAGRKEYVVMLSGIELMRQMTVNLMLEQNGVSPAARGGALRRNPLLTSEQRTALEVLPPLSADRDSLLTASAALVALFLPRAKQLGAEIGMAWPIELEEATRRNLQRRLGLEI